MDAGLSSLFQAMFDTLTPGFLQSLGFLFGVEGEAKQLKSTLSRIQYHLKDAEDRQIKEESVRQWLRELKDAAYDAEDIVDEVEYQVLRSKIEGAQMQTRKRKLTDQDGDSSAANSGVQVVSICGMGGLGKTTLAQLAYKDERVVKHFEVKAWVYVSKDFDLMRLTKAIAVKVLPESASPLTNLELDAIQVSIQNALQEKKFLLVLDDVWHESCNDWDKLRAPLMVGARGSRILVTTRSQRVSQRVSSSMGTVPTHFLQGLSDDDSWSLFERLAFVDGDSDAHPDLVKIGKEIVNKCNGLPLAVKTLGGLLFSVVDVVQWEKILKSEIWELPEEGNDILPALRLSYHHLPAHLKRCFAYCGCVIYKGLFEVEGNKLILKWMAQGFIQPSEQMEDIGREYLADLVSRSLLNCREINYEVFFYSMHDLTHDLARSVLGTNFWKIGDEKSHGNNAEKARYMSDGHITSCNFDDFFCLKNLRALSLFCTENIPAALFIKLRHIRTLRLCGSRITELPESIGDLLQLRYLELSEMDIERLPKSTTRLYNLQTLILKSCGKLVEVPESIGDLLQLRYLDLSRTTIERLPKSTTRLYNLQTLILVQCWKLVEVPESIGDLLQLQHLDLSRCTNIERLPKSTTRLYNVQTLNLSACWRLVELPSDLSNLVNLRHLHPNSSSVSTPPRIGTLKGLQTLSNFIVGKEIGRRINELKDLIHLRGRLCISRLENVVNVEEAKEAQLKNKQKIDKLELRWKCDEVELSQEGTEEEVLNALQPHTNLKELEILGYCGVRFPTWLGDSSFSKLTYVYLGKCRCRLLPPFGRLPSLKHLSLAHLYELKKVGREFYGDGTMTGLPPLESLSFTSMPDLEELSGLESDVRHIRGIVISNCTKLSWSSLRYLTSLSLLNISSCSNITSLPNGLQHLTSLKSLEIRECPELTFLYDVDLPATLDDGLGNSNYSNPTCLPKALESLYLRGCPKIHSLPDELPTALSYLAIRDLPNLTSLGNGLEHLTSLQSLRIFDCPELTSLYDVDLPATLDDGLENSNYSNPTCLPKGLKSLYLQDCPKIHSLPEELPTTLSYLVILNCANIKSLSNGLQHLTSLQYLSIVNRPKLTSLYEVDLPATLDDGLGNSNYSNPTCLPKGPQKLTLVDCPKIPSLPEELLTTLQSLDIRDCPLLVEKYLVLAEGGNGYRCKISHIPHITFSGWLGDPADRSLFLPLAVG